jgi:hypothetical protein
MVAGTVWASDAGTIKHKCHGSLVQCYVHEKLVKGAISESCINRYYGVKATKRHAGSRSHGVLFGNTDVKDT